MNSLLARAVVAGLIAGVVLDAFLAIMLHQPAANILMFTASTIVGKVAFTGGVYILLGVVLHFGTSVFWSVVYAYASNALGQLRNWLLGTIVWGLVVDACMMLLLQVKIGQPFAPAFLQGIVSHVVFFALPVAAYLAFTEQTSRTHAAA